MRRSYFSASLAIAFIACAVASPNSEPNGTVRAAVTGTSNPYRWSRSSFPATQSYRAITFDAARGRTVAWIGLATDSTGSHLGTLSWDGVTWTDGVGANGPFPLPYALPVYDSARKRTVLARGAETWEWDGDVWRNMGIAAPNERGQYGVAFDSSRNVVVLFGGDRDDTWEYDGGAWTKRTPTVRPSVRGNFGMAFDEARNVVVMFGGLGASTYNAETWEYEGTTWTKRTLPQSPSARYGTRIVFDSTRAKIVLFGGRFSPNVSDVYQDTWEYNGTTWTPINTVVAPGGRGEFGLAFDSNRNKVVLLGGPPRYADLDSKDTWEYDGANWSARHSPSETRDRRFVGAYFDATRSAGVLFGGTDGTTGALNDDVWQWSDGVWLQNAGLSPRPGKRWQHAATFDARRNVGVVFGGNTGTSRQAGTVESNETWEFNGTWTARSLTPRPAARGMHSLAYDTMRQRIVLFGGCGAHNASEICTTWLSDTWEYDGTAWTLKSPTHSPRARYRAAMAYDPSAEKIMLFGGDLDPAVAPEPNGETWLWDGTDWVERTFLDHPSGRHDAAIATDAFARKVILFGGGGFNGTLDDTWIYDASGWTRLPLADGPFARRGAFMFFDSARKQLVLAGGDSGIESGQVFAKDTWLLRARGGTCGTTADCATGYCTDGVCCSSTSCGSCETCNGLDPGRCTAVVSEPDPDSCSGTRSCNREGLCETATGEPAATATACASGFLVDGVCCDSACTGTCMACEASKKQSGTRSGVCDVALVATDPHDQCPTADPATCAGDGTCDGRGSCRVYAKGTACGSVACNGSRVSGKICDGQGACGAMPEGLSCAPYQCAELGCFSTCATDSDCVSSYRCERGACVVNEGAVCLSEGSVRSPDGNEQSCGMYRCESGVCNTSCQTSAQCVYPNECSFEGTCVAFNAPGDTESAGCAVGYTGTPRAPSFALAMFGAFVFFERRARRRPARPKGAQQ